MLGPRKFLVQKILDEKNLLSANKMFGQKKILGPKIFWVMSLKKNCGPTNMLGWKKKFGPKILGQKKIF